MPWFLFTLKYLTSCNLYNVTITWLHHIIALKIGCFLCFMIIADYYFNIATGWHFSSQFLSLNLWNDSFTILKISIFNLNFIIVV